MIRETIFSQNGCHRNVVMHLHFAQILAQVTYNSFEAISARNPFFIKPISYRRPLHSWFLLVNFFGPHYFLVHLHYRAELLTSPQPQHFICWQFRRVFHYCTILVRSPIQDRYRIPHLKTQLIHQCMLTTTIRHPQFCRKSNGSNLISASFLSPLQRLT